LVADDDPVYDGYDAEDDKYDQARDVAEELLCVSEAVAEVIA
jgi:hypothetical protein